MGVLVEIMGDAGVEGLVLKASVPVVAFDA